MHKGNAQPFRFPNGHGVVILSVKPDGSPVSGVDACEDVHQSGFPRSVLPQKGMNLALLHREGDTLQHGYAAEGFVNPAHLQ